MAVRTKPVGRRIALLVGGLVLGTGLAWVLRQAGVPLAWVLGPLFVSAALVIGETGFQPIPGGRKFAQVMLGAAVGTQFTPAVAERAVDWLPLTVMAAAVSVALTASWSLFFKKLARVDGATAYFATLPGGMAEMATLGRRQGAEDEAVAIVQALRVTMLVLLLPFIVVHLVPEGEPTVMLGGGPVDPSGLFVLLVACAAGGFLAQILRVNNPWMLGSLGASIVIAAADISLSSVPRELLVVAQILIGTALGARFRREALVRLPRVAAAGATTIVLATVSIAIIAVTAALSLGLPAASMVLAMAPGGMVEMVLTAGALGLDAVLVTAFHLVRSVLVNMVAASLYPVWRRLAR